MDVHLRLCRGWAQHMHWLWASDSTAAKEARPASSVTVPKPNQSKSKRTSRIPRSEPPAVRPVEPPRGRGDRLSPHPRRPARPGPAPPQRHSPGAGSVGVPGHGKNPSKTPKMGWDNKPSPRQSARTTGQPAATQSSGSLRGWYGMKKNDRNPGLQKIIPWTVRS